MPYHGVSGNGFSQKNRPGRGDLLYHLLDAPVLIPQLDLQVQDLLAMTLKAEMSRFDDPGVDWADGDFVRFLSLHAVKRINPGDRHCGRLRPQIRRSEER